MLRDARVVVVRADAAQHGVHDAPGRLHGLAWSPNGRWLLTALPAADQWIFVGGHGACSPFRTSRGSSAGPPSLDGWVSGT